MAAVVMRTSTSVCALIVGTGTCLTVTLYGLPSQKTAFIVAGGVNVLGSLGLLLGDEFAVEAVAEAETELSL